MKQSDPLPGRCDEALRFPEMRTVFECQERIGHPGMCHFQDGPVSSRIAGSFSIDWWPEDIAWIAVHVALVAAYLAWRSSAGFDAVIIAVNLFCVIVHLIAMAAPDLTEADR